MQEKYERLTDSEWKVMAGFLPVQRKRKINLRDVVDMGYTGPFHQACMDHLGAPAEVSSKPPSEKGFVPIKWRWVSERTFGRFNFYRSLSKDYE
jgi:transposase